MDILVVDDAIVARKMIRRHLGGSPFESANVLEASSAEKGLEMFTTNKDIKVVMSDWNMPGMNGLEFVAKIRAQEQAWGRGAHEQVPIIMITTEGTVQKVNQAKEAGVNEYIVKPFSSEQLVEALEQVLG